MAPANAEAGSSRQLELDNTVLPAPMSKKAAKAVRPPPPPSSPLAPVLLPLIVFADLPCSCAFGCHQQRAAEAPLAWGALPPIPDSKRKDMTREYHALKLRNSLDPKRFYKGQGSNKVVPEVFAVRPFAPLSFLDF